MKKSFIMLSLLLTACVGSQNDDLHTTSIFNPAPAQTIRNEKCENVPAIKLFQVLDNFALAYTCEERSYSDEYSCYGMTVYVPKNKNELFYDDKIIEPKEGQCISYNGTYKYESRNGAQHTVPKVKIIESELPNPEYQKWVKGQEKK